MSFHTMVLRLEDFLQFLERFPDTSVSYRKGALVEFVEDEYIGPERKPVVEEKFDGVYVLYSDGREYRHAFTENLNLAHLQFALKKGTYKDAAKYLRENMQALIGFEEA